MNIHQQFPIELLNVNIYIYIHTKYNAKDAPRIGYLSICVLLFEPLQIQGEQCPYGLGTLPNETGSTSCHSCPEGCWTLNHFFTIFESFTQNVDDICYVIVESIDSFVISMIFMPLICLMKCVLHHVFVESFFDKQKDICLVTDRLARPQTSSTG